MIRFKIGDFMKYRLTTVDDADQMYKLAKSIRKETTLYGYDKDFNHYKGIVENNIGILCEYKGSLVGSVIAHNCNDVLLEMADIPKNKNAVVFMNFQVNENYRGMGVGYSLIRNICLVMITCSSDCDYAVATVGTKNIASLKSFFKAGFEVVNSRVFSDGKSRYILRRSLRDAKDLVPRVQNIFEKLEVQHLV